MERDEVHGNVRYVSTIAWSKILDDCVRDNHSAVLIIKICLQCRWINILIDKLHNHKVYVRNIQLYRHACMVKLNKLIYMYIMLEKFKFEQFIIYKL